MPAFEIDRDDFHSGIVTQEDIERALDGTPAPFPEPEDPDEAQDELPDDEARGLVSAPIVAATIPQRIANSRRLRTDRVNVGVNMCLYTVRGPTLGLPALYPTAAVAGSHSSPFHKKATHTAEVPRGAIGFAFNGRAGHVWLELGAVKVDGKPDALVSTTDFHEPGFVGVALRSRMLPWCGAESWGWGESVEGFPVWEDTKPPKDHEVHTWPWKRRVTFLRNEAKRDEKTHPHMARQLRAWADRIEANHQ